MSKYHKDDVNTIAWDCKNSSQVIYTGSDDCNILVWDWRIFGENQKPVGALIGHQEGITHISSKGDSRHLLSNGKDQIMKNWDIRFMHSLEEISRITLLI